MLDHTKPPAYVSLLDIYRSFPYEWDLFTDNMKWSSPARYLLGDLLLRASGDHYMSRLTLESFQRRIKSLSCIDKDASTFECSYTLRAPDQTLHHIRERGYVYRNDAGHICKIRGALSLLPSLDIAGEVVDQPFDTLTALPTKSALASIVREVGAKEGNTSAAYLKLMLNRVGLLALQEGKDITEKIIKDISELIGVQIRSQDVLVRVAGNCFGLIIANCVKEDLVNVAKRLVSTIEKTALKILKEKVPLSISIGGALFELSRQANIDAILEEAEIALLDMQNLKNLDYTPDEHAHRSTDALSPKSQRKRRATDSSKAADNQASALT